MAADVKMWQFRVVTECKLLDRSRGSCEVKEGHSAAHARAVQNGAFNAVFRKSPTHHLFHFWTLILTLPPSPPPSPSHTHTHARHASFQSPQTQSATTTLQTSPHFVLFLPLHFPVRFLHHRSAKTRRLETRHRTSRRTIHSWRWQE